MIPWNNWFHCIGSTYGTWLRGDPRGWRARHHREHVDGDYRKPPASGEFDALLNWSVRAMKRAPVVLRKDHRVIACRGMGKAFGYHDVELIDLSVGATHFHLLARFTPLQEEASPGIRIPGLRDPDTTDRYDVLKRTARHFVGIAKSRSARALSGAGLVPVGGVWAVRGSIQAVRNRAHQLNVARYIRGHAGQGAAVWSLPGDTGAFSTRIP